MIEQRNDNESSGLSKLVQVDIDTRLSRSRAHVRRPVPSVQHEKRNRCLWRAAKGAWRDAIHVGEGSVFTPKSTMRE
eukprot:4575283-Prymnesium_polylepis.1